MRLLLLLVTALSVTAATGVVVVSRLREGSASPAQDVTRTLPTVADRAAATGAPIRMEDAPARLPVHGPDEYVDALAGAGDWILLERLPRIGQFDTGEPELVLWNPGTNQRNKITTWSYARDHREDVVGFDGTWLLIAQRQKGSEEPVNLLLFKIKTGERRNIATFDPKDLIDEQRPEASVRLSNGAVLLAETTGGGSTDEHQQLRMYSIEHDRWETLVDNVPAHGEPFISGVPMIGGDQVAWREYVERDRSIAFVILNRKTGRRIRLESPPDYIPVLHALTADGRYLLWSGGAPDRPTEQNTYLVSPRRLFATNLQTWETIDVDNGANPPVVVPVTANIRFAATPSLPFQHEKTVWGILYDARAAEVRSIVGEQFRDSGDVLVLGDWRAVGERGVTPPGAFEPEKLETLYFFRLPR